MIPYYNCPFTQFNKSSANMPANMPAAMPEAPVPFVPPTMQPMCPPMQPMQPVQNLPFQPMCPPMMPTMPHMPSMYPSGGYPMMPYMDDMDTMEDMDDMAPATIRPDDPPPKISNNPAVASVVLFKELSAYPNYGNPSGNADILYTGNRGTWTIQVPNYLLSAGSLDGQLIIHAALDDHDDVAVNKYSARITVNGRVVHTGPLPLVHGSPRGGRFNNWRNLTFNIQNVRANNRIVIVNTSTAGTNDWIGLDWMELRLNPR